MSDLVLIHHNEPVTTSLAIAKGVDLQHKNVLELINKHADSLAQLGRVEFEIQPPNTDSETANSAFHSAASHAGVELETRNLRSDRGRPTQVAYLNEQQATLLVTFMRNSPLVIKFKVALVRAFFELRDKLAAQQLPQPGGALFLSHAADVMVAADRTFRAVIRSGRVAGLTTAQAIRRANEVARLKTGVCMLDELQAHSQLAALEAPAPINPEVQRVLNFWAEYEAGAFASGACLPILTVNAYELYSRWVKQQGAEPLTLPRWSNVLQAAGLVTAKRKRYQDADGNLRGPASFMYPAGCKGGPDDMTEVHWLGTCVDRINTCMEK